MKLKMSKRYKKITESNKVRNVETINEAIKNTE